MQEGVSSRESVASGHQTARPPCSSYYMLLLTSHYPDPTSHIPHLMSQTVPLAPAVYVLPLSLFRFIHRSKPKKASAPMTSKFAKRLRFFPR
jgi:hypothetical protein